MTVKLHAPRVEKKCAGEKGGGNCPPAPPPLDPPLIPADKKVPVFLNAVGGTTYGILRNLLAPANRMDKSFEEQNCLNFDPKPLIVYHFHKR